MKKILLFLFIISSVSAEAQSGFSFNRVSKDDGIGLASDIVLCTYQDKRGFIWAGTSNGLQRFDGSKFIQFSNTKGDGGQMPVAEVNIIFPKSDNELWLLMGTLGKVGIFNSTSFKFSEVPVRPDKPLPLRLKLRLYKTVSGAVLLFIHNFGVLTYDEEQNAFVSSNFYSLPAGWRPSLYFYEDKKTGRTWLPCPDSGLAVYDSKLNRIFTPSNNPLNIPLLNNREIQKGVTEIFIDSKKRHWVFSWVYGHRYYCFDENGLPLKDTTGISANREYAELRRFFESRSGTVWLYGGNALYNLDEKTRSLVFYPQAGTKYSAIQYSSIFDIMEDNDGLLWISTDNGLYYTSSISGTTSVMNYTFRNNEGGNIEVTDLMQLKGRQYWLSTWGNGIFTIDKNYNRYDAGVYRNMPAMDKATSILYKQVWSLHQAADGKVWIGCQSGRYIIYDTATRQSQFKDLKEAEGATIRYISSDKQSNIWMATQRGNIIKFDGKDFSIVQKFGVTCAKMLFDKDGSIWATAEGQGLYHFDSKGKILHHFSADTKPTGLFNNYGEDIDQMNDSIIVYGGGVLNFINKKTGEIKWLGFEDGLPGNNVRRIRKDALGYLWVNTDDGLCRYCPFNGRITRYGRKDGMEFDKFAKIADFLSDDGFVMFAGSSHLLSFNPELFKDSKTPPDVTITDFKLFDTYIPIDSLMKQPFIKLGHDKNSISISFASLSFMQREKLTYYYMLDDVDPGWLKTTRPIEVSYSLLPPGDYVFKVYCENIDGIRTKRVTELHIHIMPPFWRTGWFISLMLMLLATIVYFMHSLRVKRLLAVENIRTKVARDLHDDMGSTLSTINILSAMAKSKLNSDAAKTGEYISKISESSQRMMEAMDDIVWSIKPSNDSMQRVCARMREFATSVLEAKDIELEFLTKDEVFDVKLGMEERRDFFLVFKEAVNNAAKYSRAQHVKISVSVEGRMLVLDVKDDGKGFDVKSAINGNGLGNMQKRAASLRAKLIIQSTPGTGTEVKLTVPVNR